MWYLEDTSGNRIASCGFETREDAATHLSKMGPVFEAMFLPVHRGGDAFVDRILNEGLVKHDLDNILLPRISIDEYTPSDPNTDNVVLGFYIKGVPDAVIPFKNFCEKCNGVIDVDYSDSDLIPNASVVYVEMDRENLKLQDIRDLMIQVAMLTDFELEDFTMTFPHTDTKFPYNLAIMQKYFVSRNRKKNMMAQRKAEQKAQDETEQQVSQLRKAKSADQDQETSNESLVSRITDLIM